MEAKKTHVDSGSTSYRTRKAGDKIGPSLRARKPGTNDVSAVSESESPRIRSTDVQRQENMNVSAQPDNKSLFHLFVLFRFSICQDDAHSLWGVPSGLLSSPFKC